MPILRKKLSSKRTAKKTSTQKRADNFVSDVTIDDFANSPRTTARFKKAATNVSSEVKHEAVIQEDKGQSWDENNEIDSINVNNTKKNQKGTVNQRRSRKAKQEQTEIVSEEEGVDYPLDVWFIISEYISPEAVGKFAQICSSSYHVTTTGKFWFHLYKSYYRHVPGMPERLQPQCMVRTYELRACVIRTLHYTYFGPQREVEEMYHLRQQDPHSLVNRQCCVMWHKEVKARWYFFFKLKEVPKSRRNVRFKEKAKKKTDFLEMLEDIAVNPEEGCKVLRVTCLKYSMLPPVIGLILQSVSITLMPGFKDHRLDLRFGTSMVFSTQTNHIILNNVINYQVLDWWHPSYPHQNQGTAIELPEVDFWD